MIDTFLETDVEKKPWEGFELNPLPELKEAFSFFNFQAYTIYKTLSQGDKFFISLPTGTGKTLCSIAAFLYYKQVYPNSQLLVVTTTSALFQYRAEFDKFFNHSLRIQVIHNSDKEIEGADYKETRKKLILSWAAGELDVLITNYPMLMRVEDVPTVRSRSTEKKKEGVKKEPKTLDVNNLTFHTAIKQCKKRKQNVVIVFDEATTFKSLSTQTSKIVSALSKHSDKIIGMTATLIKGKLEEIYGMFKNVGLQLCETKKRFEELYCITWQHPTIWYIKQVRGYKNVLLFKEKIDPYTMVLRKKDIAASLPPFQIKKTILDISTEQNELLKEIYTGLLTLTNEGVDYENFQNTDSQKILEALTEVGYIKRALQSPEIVSKERFSEDSPKTEEIIRMLSEDFVDEKIVIYTPSKKYLKILSKTIKGNKEIGKFYKHPLEICGDVSAEQRFQNVQDFSSTQIHNILLLDDAGSEAINLQAASVLIITAMPDSWGRLIQLVGRISRIGSKHESLLLVFLLHKDSQDIDEYTILQRQGVLFQALHGEVEQGLLDTSVLREKEEDFGISDDEFVSKSVSHLLIGTRQRRALQYRG